jgi:hypothetical protein
MIQFLLLFCVMSLTHGVSAMDGAGAGVGSSQNPGGSPGKGFGEKKVFRMPESMRTEGSDDDIDLDFGYYTEGSVSDGDDSGNDIFRDRTPSPFTDRLKGQFQELMSQAAHVRRSLERSTKEAQEVAARTKQLVAGQESQGEHAASQVSRLDFSNTQTTSFVPSPSLEEQFEKIKNARRIQELESELQSAQSLCAQRESVVLRAEEAEKTAQTQLREAKTRIASLEAAQQPVPRLAAQKTVPSDSFVKTVPSEIKPEEIKPAPKQSNYPALATASLSGILASRLLASAWGNKKGLALLRSRKRRAMTEEEREAHEAKMRRFGAYSTAGALAALASGYGAYQATGSMLKTFALLLAAGLLERGATATNELFLEDDQEGTEGDAQEVQAPLPMVAVAI